MDPYTNRYPNQFFDISQQYMPPTIKELFKWCTYYYYNSPLIGAAIKKISRYPITDLLFEDSHESVRDVWETILVDEMHIKNFLMEVNLDRHVYGNAFVSVHLPFTRFLICKSCGHRKPIKQWRWSFRGSDNYHFRGTCDECGRSGAVDVKDIPYKDRRAMKLIRWNPENIFIKFNEYTGRYVYMYRIPSKLRTAPAWIAVRIRAYGLVRSFCSRANIFSPASLFRYSMASGEFPSFSRSLSWSA